MTPGATLWRVLACLAVLPVAVLLGVRSYEGLHTTRELVAPQSTTAAAATAREFACLEDEFDSAVPAGTAVFLDIDDPLWYQRAAAATFPHLTLVTTEDDADLVVRLRTPERPAPCADGGIEVVVPGRTP